MVDPTAGTSFASSASRGAPSPETWISCATRRAPPLEYDEARHGFRLTDETFSLPPVRISRREAFSFALARKLLAQYEATPLHMDMRAVLDKIAESLEGDIGIEPGQRRSGSAALRAARPHTSSH
jgi:predicted DNA-binding transcriptional regulator YafY